MKKNPFIARLAILTFTLVASSMPLMAQEESMGIHQALKTKFVEGNAGFMSLVAIALVVGLAFCIERILYLSLQDGRGRYVDDACTEVYCRQNHSNVFCGLLAQLFSLPVRRFCVSLPLYVF